MSVDIVSAFSGYVGKPGLHTSIEHAGEFVITTRLRALQAELGKLRTETIAGHAYLDEKGNVKVTPSPELDDLRARIVDKEVRLNRLLRIANEINALLDGHGVESISALLEIRKDLQGTANARPGAAWRLLVSIRGEGQVIPAKIRTDWFVSDMVELPEFKIEEERMRKEYEQAKADIVPIKESLEKIDALVSEARHL